MKGDGARTAIATMEALDDPAARLVIVGDGDDRRALERQAGEVNARLGRRAVVFTGALLDPRPAYAGADVVLAMGGAALRGLAFGKPVVVLGERGFLRLFEPDSAPYFFRHGYFGTDGDGDPVTALATTLRRLSDDELRSRLGRLGLRVVRERNSLEGAGDRLEAVYRQAQREPPGWVASCLDVGRSVAYATAAARLPGWVKRLLPGAARGARAGGRA
jgi:glycosyltransferase involved in cell wall biosynthesis